MDFHLIYEVAGRILETVTAMTASIPQVRKQLLYRPFRPFWLETVGGTRIYVHRAEWFHEMPDGPLIILESGTVTLTWWSDLTETIEIEGPA